MDKTQFLDLFNRFTAKKSFKFTRSQNWLMILLICIFLVMTFLGDGLYPCKNVRFFYDWPSRYNIDMLTMRLQLNPAMRYSGGHGSDSFQSLVYVTAVKFFYFLIPYRLLCLRLVSVFTTCIALFFLYHLAVFLFRPVVGAIFVFILVTTPIYVESMRAFGFIPITNMIVVIACYFLAVSMDKRKIFIKVALLALSSFITLSLYVLGRLVIFFPIAFYCIYLKQSWRKLLLFLLIFISLILIPDLILGDIHFNLKRFILVGNEWLVCHLSGAWLKENPQGTAIDLLGYRLSSNIKIAAEYLFQIDRKHFTTKELWTCKPRLFNIAYTPFFYIGLIICVWKKRKSNIFLFVWFFIFFAVPLLSSHMPVRRVIFSLNPIYLFIALGMWSSFKFIYSKLKINRHKLILICISALFLASVGSLDIYEYIFNAAKPYYKYSHKQLKQLAVFISDRGKEVESIKYNARAPMLIWGNPHFDNSFIDMNIVGKMDIAGKRGEPHTLKEQVRKDIRVGISSLYIYSSVYAPDDYDEEEESFYPDIQWIEKNLADEVEISQVQGIEEVYFLIVKQ